MFFPEAGHLECPAFFMDLGNDLRVNDTSSLRYCCLLLPNLGEGVLLRPNSPDALRDDCCASMPLSLNHQIHRVLRAAELPAHHQHVQ